MSAMYDTSSAGIDSSMDALLEEELQAVNLDEDVDDDYDDNYDVIIDQDGPRDLDLDGDFDDVELPPEVNDYIHTLESQTRNLEKELEECDELLLYMPHESKGQSKAVMLYDDYKDLEQAAQEQGMTVEEFKQKVLSEAAEDDFTEEDMTRELEEFAQLQKELAEVRATIRTDNKKDLLAIEAPTENGTESESTPLAITGDDKDAEKTDASGSDSGALVKFNSQPEEIDEVEPEVGPLVSMAALTSMRDYIVEQLKKADEWHEIKKQKLVQSIDQHKHEEEKQLMAQEERKKKLDEQQKVEEAALMRKKMENERNMEEEQKVRDARLTEELQFHQAEIDKLSAALQEEKHQYETSRRELLAKLEETRKKAATQIQKVYRGHRARKENTNKIQELNEWKTLKKSEKEKLRLMELEYEIKYRDEQAKKDKEEQEKREAEEKRRKEEEEKQKEIEIKKKEEEERIAEEQRKEEERKREEERLEEERRKKEEEERKKEEEKKRKEEERLRKEEEKKKKEEEKKRQKEEEKRKKEEEKKRKEEEKRKKEEEKKAREEEERLRKEEEKRKKEEEKKNDDEEKQKKLAVEKQAEEQKKSEDKTDDKNNDGKLYENFVGNKDGEDAKAAPENNLSQQQQQQQTLLQQQKHLQQSQPQPDQQKENAPAHQSSSPLVSHIPHPPAHPPPSHTKIPAAAEKSPTAPSSSPPAPSATAVKATTPSVAPTPQDMVTSMPEPPPPKPDPVEIQRMNWIKSCTPWSKVSNEPWKLKQTSQKSHKRPTHGKKLPAVTEAVVLAAAQAETLRQVSAVKLVDLPGCSLSTLGQCWSLRYLTVNNCGLVSLDGLNQCRHLLYINAENNNIEYIELKDLGSLQVARLANNHISSIHGFEGCINLRWLDLSHNRITRISGLGSVRRIHTLNLSHNQVVSAEGLEEAVTLQQLDLSHNYLQHFIGVHKLCLLTYLDLSSNNLLEVPELKNQVLLQTLNVQENSIKSIETLEQYWLPLLHVLNCSQNMLEKVEGVDKLIMLSHLDVSLNQITEVEQLTSGLTNNERLETLVLEGNPLTEVYCDVYITNTAKALPFVKTVDTNLVNKATPAAGSERVNDDFIDMCLSQIQLHGTLKTEFDTQIKVLLTNRHVTSETLCSTYFSYCDTSFKMAAEHRSAHEYGDISVSSSISKFVSSPSPRSVKHMRNNNTQEPRPSHNDMLDKKAQFDAALNTSNNNSEFNSLLGQKSQFDAVLDKKAQFDAFLASQGQSTASSSFSSVTPHSSITATGESQHHTSKLSMDAKANRNNSNAMNDIHIQRNSFEGALKRNSVSSGQKDSVSSSQRSQKGAKIQKELSDSSDMSDSDDSPRHGENAGNITSVQHKPPHPPAAPAPMSYLNEKDKFEMALQGQSGKSSHTSQAFAQNQFAARAAETVTANHSASSSSPFGQYMSGKDRFEIALQNQSPANVGAPSAKDKFNAALLGNNPVSQAAPHGSGSVGGHKVLPGVKADVVGNQMAMDGDGIFDDFELAALGFEGEVDMEALEFDIDKYLDMGELDEFLEKGWRPADAPQIPQSSYPVLGKINSSGVPSMGTDQTASVPYKGFGPTPPPPPQQPSQAWRDSPVSELRGKPPRPAYNHGAMSPAVPQSPLSVASHAETMEGGSMRSKKDELSEEWGFKDSRTAEMMMARAKKMKYNAERKQKLRKLDPKQRLQLMKKLEEKYKVQPVRPPPAKVLPRKEYFQAREEEAQRVEFERRTEEHTRVHRTFEWLHTQVGDHPVASSRINPVAGPAYINPEAAAGRHNANYGEQYTRRTSPLSDHLESASRMGQHYGHQERRYSIGEPYSGHTPTLPPIQVGSAPSTHKNERISFRDNPVERSGGWGGGKKRTARK